QSKLNERANIQNKKQCLQAFVSIHESVSKIEALLQIPVDESHKSEKIAAILFRADEETSKLIQRVANECNQLKFYVSKWSSYPFVRKMEPRIRLIENSLQKGMEHLF